MLDILIARFRQGHRTLRYPKETPALPDHYKGMPVIDSTRCGEHCDACMAVCPTGAIASRHGVLGIHMGACLFCGRCEQACERGGVRFSREHRLSSVTQSGLMVTDAMEPRAATLAEHTRKLFGRALRLRQVSAGGCSACEADTNVLGTVVFDLGRFGVQFVASPRHADGLLITGPVTKNMAEALRKTYDAVPDPKIVIATGACAITGGIFAHQDEVLGSADAVVPVDVYIPGCPPHPLTILDGILQALGRA